MDTNMDMDNLIKKKKASVNFLVSKSLNVNGKGKSSTKGECK